MRSHKNTIKCTPKCTPIFGAAIHVEKINCFYSTTFVTSVTFSDKEHHELRLATWDQFNISESLWTIPKKNTKTDVIHKIHLSQQVRALLDELRQISSSQYVVAGAFDNEPLTENALARAARRANKYIDIPHWTIHDLRRTFSTHLDETLHINPIVIEKCLAHRMHKIMAVYNKSEMLPERRDALNQWGRYIENVVINSNVIALEQVA